MTTVNAISAEKPELATLKDNIKADKPQAQEPIFANNKSDDFAKTQEIYPNLKLSEISKKCSKMEKSDESKTKKFFKGALSGLIKVLSNKWTDLAVIGFICSAAVGYAMLGGIVLGGLIGLAAAGFAIKEGMANLNYNQHIATL